MASRVPLHIAIFDCDTPVPSVYAKKGMYGDIFETILRNAAETQPGIPVVRFEFTRYDCVRGDLPSYQDLELVDGIIITGSAAASYDSDPWIVNLVNYVKNIYTSHPQIKLFGSCFGHQIIAHALFSTPSHRVVSRDPSGYETGIHPIALSPPFLSHFGPVTSNRSSPHQLRMQFVHGDHVVLNLMPEGFHSIGRSDHCALQGIWRQGRVLTYQGHAEFDTFVNAETIAVFAKLGRWEAGFLERSLEGTRGEDDAGWAVGVMVRFFLEDEVVGMVGKGMVVRACEEREILAML